MKRLKMTTRFVWNHLQTKMKNQGRNRSEKDFLLMELDEKKDLHMTMIYSKGIGKRVDLLEVFRQAIKLLNGDPKLIEEYSSLPYFGMEAMQYWAETRDEYPKNVVPREGWKPMKEEVVEYQTTIAGSVVDLKEKNTM